MDYEAILRTLLEAMVQNVLPDQAVLNAVVRDERARAQVLSRPALLASLQRIARLRSGIDCATVEIDLAAYVDAEQQGEDVAALYGDVSLHLSQCPDCYERYVLATSMISAQQQGTAPPWSLLIPPPSPVPAPWTLVVPRVEIQRAIAMQARKMVMRGTREHFHILYDGELPGYDGMFAEVTLTPSVDEPVQWNISVRLSGEGVRANLDVRLLCDQDTRSARTNARGEAHFDAIPHAWILPDDAPDLRVEISTP